VPTGREVLRGSSVEDTAYDPDKFYVTAVDKQGHFSRVNLSVDTGVYAAIQNMIAGGMLRGTPMKNVNDVMRAATVDILHKMARLTDSPEMAALAEHERVKAEIGMVRQRMANLRAFINDTEDALSDASVAKDPENARVIIHHAQSVVDSMPEPYAGELRRVIDNASRKL
jgi:hypothetical protein